MLVAIKLDLKRALYFILTPLHCTTAIFALTEVIIQNIIASSNALVSVLHSPAQVNRFPPHMCWQDRAWTATFAFKCFLPILVGYI